MEGQEWTLGSRKRIFWVILLALLLEGLFAVQPATSAPPPPKTYRVADIYPSTHPIYLGSIKWWIEEMDARTKGLFKAQWFGNATLAAGPDIAKSVIDGTVHIGNCLYASPMVPLQDVVALPKAFEDSQLVAASQAFAKMVKSGLINDRYEKLGIKVLFGYTTTNYQIFSTKKPVLTLHDLKGLKIRTAGTTLPKTVASLGGVPVNMAMGEATDALQKGVVDGIALGVPSLKPYPFYDLIKFANIGFSLGGFPIIYGMNKAAWEALPADIRSIMDQVNEAAPVHAAEYYLGVVKRDLQEFQNRKMRVDTLPAADITQVAAQVAPIWREWADSLEAKGIGGKRIVEDFKNALRQNGVAIQ
jgi:TRAP-type C4-dicarboxylate transport system substrate-binding protein